MSGQDLGAQINRKRKLRDGAMLLPIFGAFLLISPLITIFYTPASFFGIPSVFLYVFGVWIGLVMAARAMARRLDLG